MSLDKRNIHHSDNIVLKSWVEHYRLYLYRSVGCRSPPTTTERSSFKFTQLRSQSTIGRDCDSPVSIPSPVSPPLPSYELSGTPKSISRQHSPLAPDFSPITNSNASVAVSIRMIYTIILYIKIYIYHTAEIFCWTKISPNPATLAADYRKNLVEWW